MRAAAAAARIVPPGGGKAVRSLRGKAGAAGRIARWSAVHRDDARPLIWYHAPSVGEGLMARPVLTLLRERIPSAQFAYTFYSPSAEEFARSLPVDVADYLPFDTTAAARALLAALRPQALVFSKADVWPILVHEAAAQRVPTALTSAALASGSGRTSLAARWLLRDAYASLAAVGAVHGDDAFRLAAMGVPRDRIRVTGDVRYDQVWQLVSSVPKHGALLQRLASTRPTLVAGSTWPADEHVLLAAWADVVRRVPGARLIIAPHEPSDAHTRGLQEWATRHRLASAPIDFATDQCDVVIVDRMGVLAELYAAGRVAFVGGGFHAKGLHSVVEPAAHGLPVIVGPAGTASRDAAALIGAGGAFVEASAVALANRVSGFFANDALRADAGSRARRVIECGLGAAASSAQLVETLLCLA